MTVCLLVIKKKERHGLGWKGDVTARGGEEDLEEVEGREAVIRMYCVINNPFQFMGERTTCP